LGGTRLFWAFCGYRFWQKSNILKNIAETINDLDFIFGVNLLQHQYYDIFFKVRGKIPDSLYSFEELEKN